MPRSPLAPPADGSATPGRRRAVIASTTGVIASTVGLVLLGIGSAAASTGPSPGPAAGPLPKLSATTLVAAPASSGAVEIAVDVAVGAPPSPALPRSSGSGGDVDQQGPVPSVTAATASWAAADLPSTGQASDRMLLLAGVSLITGAALLAARRLRPSARREAPGSGGPVPIPVRVDRRR